MNRFAIVAAVCLTGILTSSVAFAQPGTGSLDLTFEYDLYSAEDVTDQLEWEVFVSEDGGQWSYYATFRNEDTLIWFIVSTPYRFDITVRFREPEWVYEGTFSTHEEAAIAAFEIERLTGRVTRIEEVISEDPRDLSVVSEYDLMDVPHESTLEPVRNPYESGSKLTEQQKDPTRSSLQIRK